MNSYPLRALADGEDGGNGVYPYASGGGFPTGSFKAANYWVDVVFSTDVQDNTGPDGVRNRPRPPGRRPSR